MEEMFSFLVFSTATCRGAQQRKDGGAEGWKSSAGGERQEEGWGCSRSRHEGDKKKLIFMLPLRESEQDGETQHPLEGVIVKRAFRG